MINKSVVSLVLITAMGLLAFSAGAQQKRLLIYTKNGDGFVHDKIVNSIKVLKKIGMENGFIVDASDDPSLMSEENLQKYDALIFSNTNNETFDTC